MDDTVTPCAPVDVIHCTFCDKRSMVASLKLGEGDKAGQTLPKPGGGTYSTKYYYCPYCDDERAKVFDPGDGRPLELGGNVKLVN